MMKNFFENLKIKLWMNTLFDPSKPKWIYISLSLIVIFSIFSSVLKEKEKQPGSLTKVDSEESTDTYIPIGYVLVPLEITNAAAISGLMGRFTFVDVYTTAGLETNYKKVIAKNLRMLRAPHDNEQFAVLVREAEFKLIHNLSEPVFIVIKNPTTKQTEEVTNDEVQPQKLKKSRISYGF